MKPTKLDQLKSLCAKPAQTRKGNETAAARITITNQFLRGSKPASVALAQAKRK